MQNAAGPIAYLYSPLQADRIRLLVLYPGKGTQRLNCRLEHVSITALPQYETISYAWGDVNDIDHILCEEQQIKITKSLHSALLHLRYSVEERVVWADAICINQEDVMERSAQVALMGQIYALSKGVIIWLGEENEQCSSAFAKIEALDSYFRSHESGYPDGAERWVALPELGQDMNYSLQDPELDWHAPVVPLLCRPWFVRRWVIQELALSPSATLVFRGKTIDWRKLAEVLWSLMKAGLMTHVPEEYLSLPFEGGVQSVLLMEEVRRDVMQSKGSDLLPAIASTFLCKCSDPRDVIYSLLGVIRDYHQYEPQHSSNTISQHATPWAGVRPDYTLTAEQVFHRFVISCIVNKKTLLPLSFLHMPSDPPILPLPSWVPNFSALLSTNPLMFLRNESALPFRASQGATLQAMISSDWQTLHVLGRQVDTIQSVIPPVDEFDLPAGESSNVKAPTTNAIGGDFNTKLVAWIDACLQLLRLDQPSTETIYGVTTEKLGDFLRTLVCNLTVPGDRPGDETMAAMFEWIETLFESEAIVRRHSEAGTSREYLRRLMKVDSAFFMRAFGWGFCMTESGRMGRCLKSARIGDQVVLLYGGELPYILRERIDGGWTFITSCYIHGLMDGEGMVESVSDIEFDLH